MRGNRKKPLTKLAKEEMVKTIERAGFSLWSSDVWFRDFEYHGGSYTGMVHMNSGNNQYASVYDNDLGKFIVKRRFERRNWLEIMGEVNREFKEWVEKFENGEIA